MIVNIVHQKGDYVSTTEEQERREEKEPEPTQNSKKVEAGNKGADSDSGVNAIVTPQQGQ